MENHESMLEGNSVFHVYQIKSNYSLVFRDQESKVHSVHMIAMLVSWSSQIDFGLWLYWKNVDVFLFKDFLIFAHQLFEFELLDVIYELWNLLRQK